ncbi:MAG: hypothetical protein ABGX46_03840 [Candidatus Thioglobus sp.]|jgi:cyanate permease
MLKNKIKFAIVALSIAVITPVLAHVTPEHVLGLSHDSANSWSLFEIVLLICTLLVVIGFLSREQKMDKG